MKKVINLSKMDPVEVINDTLREALDVLRQDVKPDGLYFILYLILLHSENISPNVDLNEDMEETFSLPEIDIEGIDNESQRSIVETLYDLHDIFKEDILKFRRNTWSVLYTLINSIDVEVLKENLAVIFEEQLYRIGKYQGKAGGNQLIPIEIIRILISIADLPEMAKVYNPFAGFASIGSLLKEFHFYLGQEIDQQTWAVGILRLIANKRSHTSFLIKENSLDEEGFKSTFTKAEPGSLFNKFELVISAPPFNARLPKEIKGQFGTIPNYESFFIEKGIEELSENGKLIALISQSFLFKSGFEQNLRKYLIDNDLIEMVISLPGGILMNTGIPTSILVVNKNKNQKGIVRFIDAKDFVDVVSGRKKNIKYEILNNIITNNKESESLHNVSNKEIAENDFNLLPSRYVIKLPDEAGVKIINLGEVAKVRIKEGAIQPGTKGRFIRIRDLKSDPINFFLNPKEIEFAEISSSAIEIQYATALLALRFKKLRPSLINGSNEQVFISNDILPLQINESLIEPDYLVAELNSDFVQKQVEAYSYGSTIQSISKKDVLCLKIRVPSKEEQRAKVHGLREEYLRSKHKELDLTREILGLKDESFREFASIKHTLSQYLNALKSNVSGTLKFISRNHGQPISVDSVYSENLNQNLGDHLQSLEYIIDSMSKLLHSSGEQSVKSELPALEMEMDLEKLVVNAQNRFKNPDIFLFEEFYIDKESFTWDGEAYVAPYINILAEDFYRIFSNIISNAVDHGFKERINNIIRVSLSHDWENEKLILEISNNGHTLPVGFTLKHLTTRGEKTTNSKGMGIGGADIKHLLDMYDATLDVRNEPEEEFPVTYIIRFNLAVTIL